MRPGNKLLPLIAIAVCWPLTAHGDALAELRTTLSQLNATTAVRGVFEVVSTNTNSDEPQAFAGKAAASFEMNDAGLQVIYPKNLLAQATQEARNEEIDPDRQTPVRSGMSRIRTLSIVAMLDAAATLDSDLLTAQLTDVKASLYHGKTARVLALKLNPKTSKGSSKHMKSLDAHMSIWLGDDGVPVAAERTVTARVSFMLISIDSTQTENWTYVRVGDRLVATHHDSSQKTDGFGQHNSSQLAEIVSVQER